MFNYFLQLERLVSETVDSSEICKLSGSVIIIIIIIII